MSQELPYAVHDAGRPVPPVVYIPCTPSDEGELRLTLFRTADGDLTLMAFSALDRLVEGVGARTSWALVRWDDMLQIHQESPFDRVHLDATIFQQAEPV